MENFLKVNVKFPAPVETGVLISAIQFFRYEDRLSGKKKLQPHNLAQKAAEGCSKSPCIPASIPKPCCDSRSNAAGRLWGLHVLTL